MDNLGPNSLILSLKLGFRDRFIITTNNRVLYAVFRNSEDKKERMDWDFLLYLFKENGLWYQMAELDLGMSKISFFSLA